MGLTGLGYTNNSISQAKQDLDKMHNNHNNTDRLFNNHNWKQISSLWKEYNHFKPQKELKDTHDQITKLQNKFPAIKTNLDNLEQQHLLTPEQKAFILRLFDERMSYLSFNYGVVMCYSMIATAYESCQKTF